MKVLRKNSSDSEKVIENEQSKSTDKACMFRHFYIQYIAKSYITDINLRPLTRKKKTGRLYKNITVQRFHCSYSCNCHKKLDFPALRGLTGMTKIIVKVYFCPNFPSLIP